jgi:hypothetical protein
VLRVCWIIVLSLLVMTSAVTARADLTLAAGGKTGYVILLDPGALSEKPDAQGQPIVTPVQHAAHELAHFLQQVTGADFPIIVTTTPSPRPMLVVGPGAVQRQLCPDLRLDNLKPDGIVLESRHGNLFLAGDEPRGTLYAVYTFLEDTVGCHWWSAQASTIPHRPTLTVPEQHVRYIPPLEYREPYWWGALDGDWAVRNKANGSNERLDAMRGGKISYASPPGFVHTSAALVPVDKYAKDHPEYYAMRDGKRIVGDTPYCQLCMTNPDVRRIVTEQVLQDLAKNPQASIISVSQNDCDRHCLCPDCKKLEEEEGSPMGPLLDLVNYVAAAVAPKYPNVAVDTLAYQYTRKPPLHLKPLPNVIIRLCSIECDFSQPLTSASNKAFAADIVGWSKICQRLYVWDYATDFSAYISPYPNLRVLTPNIKFFVEHGVKGIFEEGAYQSPGAEFAELKAWVQAKAMWNPNLDNQQLLNEFVAGYYGPAAPFIGQYINLLHDACQSSHYYLNIGVPPTTPYLSLTTLGQAEALFTQAETAVRDDPALLTRVQVAHLPLRYVWSVRWRTLQAQARREHLTWPGPADYATNADTFMAVCQANGITMLSEGSKIDSFARRTTSLARTQAPPPPGCDQLPPEDWVDLQDDGFNLAQEGIWATLVHDDLASDKVASMMPGWTNEWATQQQLDAVQIDPNVTWDVYVSVRVEKKGETGAAFTAGIWDYRDHKSLGGVAPTCREITDPGYVTYKLGTTKLHDQCYLWVAPTANPDNVKSVYVDRFWLVKVPADRTRPGAAKE